MRANSASARQRAGQTKAKPNKGLWIIVVILVLAVIGVGGYTAIRFFSAGTQKTVELPVSIEVAEGATTKDVSNTLFEKGLIRNKNEFIDEVKAAGLDGKLLAGTYSIETTDMDSIIELLATGADTSLVKITIPEGFTNKQIAARVEEKLGIPAADFLAISDHKAQEYASKYPFLEGAYQGSMEGYLFPKTYLVPKDADATYVITKLLDQFKKEYSYLDTNWAESKGYSESQIVIIGSMVERETQLADERPIVSSVIYNRLDKDMRLQICATVEYILGAKKLRLSAKDIQTPSPYNTYLHKGLPPGPICNPGLASLEAAASPDDTEYLYYVLTGKDGSQTFSKTLEEHNKAVEKSKQVFGE